MTASQSVPSLCPVHHAVQGSARDKASLLAGRQGFTPAAEGHGLWPWMNASAFGRDVAPLGRELGATGFARGAPLAMTPFFLFLLQ